jgi:hypothetical protein
MLVAALLLLLLGGGVGGEVLDGEVLDGEVLDAATPLPSQPDLLGLSGTMGTKERLELVKKLLKQEPLIDGYVLPPASKERVDSNPSPYPYLDVIPSFGTSFSSGSKERVD